MNALALQLGLVPIPPTPANRRRVAPSREPEKFERFSIAGLHDRVFELLRDTGHATEREIADYFGIAMSLSKRIVATLEQRGRLELFHTVGASGTPRRLWRAKA